ncbi:chemotaxis protein CheB [Runella sp.]|uniref:chemotaxis protein CheB n=1 Tax=Runella sp. TaxID=1960881 RepID=UPI003D109A99
MAEDKIKRECKLLVIGGSSGSIDFLLKLLPTLNVPLSFAIILVLHRKNSLESTLTELFASKTVIPVKEVEDKDVLEPGNIYIAPADYHLLIENNHEFSLDSSEKINFSRPSVDVTFESAAEVYGSSLVGVVLSGANADGTNGLKAIKRAGGLIIAQKPETAQVAYMPEQAISNNSIDFIFDVNELATFINSFLNH